jgi:hypothetical protein
MKYLSTRAAGSSAAERKRFCEILLEGLASDGGLYLPESYPEVSDATLNQWRTVYHTQGYAALAFEILSLYIDDIPAADLRAICEKTYTAEVFGTGEIVPLRHLEDGLWLEALSNGPTLAFKDMAMQLLGNLFEYELARRGEELNILGATSGDTGSAAEYAMRGKKGVRVFMTSPFGRMSAFQQAQMFSLMDANIYNIAVKGVFDDCQDMVKAVSNDLAFKRKYKIGTVNSINWARCWPRWCITLPAICKPPKSPYPSPLAHGFAGATQRGHSEGQLHRAVGQLRQCLRRPCGAHDGSADRETGRGHQRERCAGRVLPHRRLPRARQCGHARDLQPVHGHFQGVELLSALCLTCWAVMARGSRAVWRGFVQDWPV